MDVATTAAREVPTPVGTRAASLPDPAHIRQRAALISVVVGVAIMLIKVGAFIVTASATILSDAMESVVHVLATGFMFYCFRYAQKPPDSAHPYGHGTAEYLSIGFEGGTIALAALAIVAEAVRVLLSGRPPTRLDVGFVFIALAGAINLVLGLYLLQVGRRHRSAILVGDAKHVLSDMWTSLGVVLGLVVLCFIHDARWQSIADAAIAIVLAGVILVAGMRLLHEAWSGLLAHADPARTQQVIDAINEIRLADWLDIHRLRMRTSGEWTFIDLHMTVPGTWSVIDCHETEQRLEKQVLSRLGSQGTVLVHFDYAGESTPTPMPVGGRSSPFTSASATRLSPATLHP